MYTRSNLPVEGPDLAVQLLNFALDNVLPALGLGEGLLDLGDLGTGAFEVARLTGGKWRPGDDHRQSDDGRD